MTITFSLLLFPRQMIVASLRDAANSEARHLVWFVTVALPALFRALTADLRRGVRFARRVWAIASGVNHLIRFVCSDHYRNAYLRTRATDRAKARK
jgi:hypothetical protein